MTQEFIRDLDLFNQDDITRNTKIPVGLAGIDQDAINIQQLIDFLGGLQSSTLIFNQIGDLFNGGGNITSATGFEFGTAEAADALNRMINIGGSMYAVTLLSDYRTLIGDPTFVPNGETSSFFVTTDYVATLIQGTNETIESKMDRPINQRSVDRAELMGAISTLMASTNRRAPRVSPLINEKLQRIMGAEYCDYVTSQSRGASNGGIVFGSYEEVGGTQLAPIVVFAAPVTNSTGSVTFDVTIEPVNGSDINDVLVEWSQWSTASNGGAQLSGRPDLVRVGNNWTLTRNLTGQADPALGDLFGLHITCAAGSGDFEIVDASLTDSNGLVHQLTDDMKRNTVVNLVGDDSKQSVRPQVFDSGVEIRNHGVKSGHIPAKVIATPQALANTGNTVANIGGTLTAGDSFHNGQTPIHCFFTMEAYYKEGYTIPAMILESGVYVNRFGSGHIRTVNLDIFDRPSEWFIGCPNGVATLNAGASNGEGVILGAVDGSVFPHVVLANIHCDNTITRPFRTARWHCQALNLVGVNSDTEGFETDYGDLTIESSSFSGAANDGINSHETGHIILIETDCFDNLDDGFSPHDNCTYEVYGGNFFGNGKGNIIPAFGAKGYAFNVTSSGSTGLSTRIANVEGFNDGGYVCLDNNQNSSSPTTMFLTECTSDGDNNGFVSAGRYSFMLTHECTANGSTNYDFLSTNWRSNTNLGDAGLMITTFSDTSGNTIMDTDNNIVNLNDELLRRT